MIAPHKSSTHFISSEKIREFSILGPWGCTLDIVTTWFSILAAIWISEKFWNPALYVLAVMWIGARQHALGTMTHDAAHWRLFNHRKVNDVVAELFCGWPLFIRMEAYRFNHLVHHQFTGTPKDPEFKKDRYPTHRKEILIRLLRDLSGLNILKLVVDARHMDKQAPVTVKTQILRALFYMTVIGATVYFGVWKLLLLYWMIPIFTWLNVILRIRAIGDHAGLSKSSSSNFYPSRTLVPSQFDRIFVAPRNVSYHLEHHLYMSVPSKNLPALHCELKKNETYLSEAHVTHGFIGLIMEFPWESRELGAKCLQP